MAIRLGNGSVSSLVRTAGSIASSITAYQDSLAAAEFQNSAQSAADFNQYAQYLQGRIGTVSSAGGVANASKALSLSQTLQSANRSFTSNEIQRQSISVLEGGGNNVDKLNTIQQLYYRAANNGDNNLAQNLRQQFDSLSQQVQYQQQQAADSSASYAKANSIAQAGGYADAASALGHALSQLSSGFGMAGQGELSTKLASTTASIAKALGAEGVSLPKGAQASNGSVIKAALQGMQAFYQHAYNIASVTEGESSKAQSYQSAIDNIATGNGLSFGGKSFSLYGGNGSVAIDDYIAQPNMFFAGTTGYDPSGQAQTGLKTSAVSGFAFDKNGKPLPVYTGNDATNYGQLPTDQQNAAKADLQKAGFTVSENNGNLYVKQSADGNNKFFQDAAKKYNLNLGPGSEVRVIPTSHGYQFMTNNVNDEHVLLTLSKDANGNFGLYGTHANGNVLLGSMNGYDTTNNVLQLASGIFSNKQSQAMNAAMQQAMTQAQARATGNTSVAYPGSIQGTPVSHSLVGQYQAPAAMPKQYVGNNDYRGHLAYMAANGNQDAKLALNYVGNDKFYYLNPSTTKNWGQVQSALNAVGASNKYQAPGNAGTQAGNLPLGIPGFGNFK